MARKLSIDERTRYRELLKRGARCEEERTKVLDNILWRYLKDRDMLDKWHRYTFSVREMNQFLKRQAERARQETMWREQREAEYAARYGPREVKHFPIQTLETLDEVVNQVGEKGVIDLINAELQGRIK